MNYIVIASGQVGVDSELYGNCQYIVTEWTMNYIVIAHKQLWS